MPAITNGRNDYSTQNLPEELDPFDFFLAFDASIFRFAAVALHKKIAYICQSSENHIMDISME